MDLSKAILNTLAYFDLFDYPLTTVEVWKWLFLPGGTKVALNEISNSLDELENNKRIGHQHGFYFLPDRHSTVNAREARHRLSVAKMTIAKREAKRLSNWFGAAGVAVSNSLAYRNSQTTGDIDFFIITRAKRLWRTRGLSATYAALLDKRPHDNKKQDQFCFCFFVAPSSLNLEKYLLPKKSDWPDIYFIYWLATLRPLAGDEKLWSAFYAANQWLNYWLPNLQFRFTGETLAIPQIQLSVTESILSKIQIYFLPQALRQMMNQTNEVVINSQAIKLHTNDARGRIREHFLKNIEFI